MNAIDIKKSAKKCKNKDELFSHYDMKFELIKVSIGNTIEINDYTRLSLIRVERGKVSVGTGYKSTCWHDPNYRYIEKDNAVILSDIAYFNVSCEDQDAVISIFRQTLDNDTWS
jgi:hypothetical protein